MQRVRVGGQYLHLPDQVTAPTATWFAYPEYKLRHVESYVNTRLGRTRQAAAAQDAAVAVYPASKYRGLSQVQLHRAACMIMDGFVEEGITHATTILQGLPTDLRHDALVSNLAHAALTAVPTPARTAYAHWGWHAWDAPSCPG